MYTTILFDFFDVIHADPFKAWLKKHNFGDPNPYLKLMEEVDMGRLSVEDLLQKYHELSHLPHKEIVEDFAHKPLLDERTPKLIERLNKRYKVGLLSNAATEEIVPVLEAHGYRNLFHYIFISGEVGLIKPAPEAFKHVLQKLDSKPQETIFIDDSPTNIQAAGDIGITGILFRDFPQLEADLKALQTIG